MKTEEECKKILKELQDYRTYHCKGDEYNLLALIGSVLFWIINDVDNVEFYNSMEIDLNWRIENENQRTN